MFGSTRRGPHSPENNFTEVDCGCESFNVIKNIILSEEKVIYFTDSSDSQYKKNFLHVWYHVKDYGMKAG